MAGTITPEEIPEEFRDTFFYEDQPLVPNHNGTRRVRKIRRQCAYCPNTLLTEVGILKADRKRGRSMLPGKCKDCKGRYITPEGYVWVHAHKHPRAYNKRYVPEHVLVMERSVGRYLVPGETVHHINGVRGDNRIENLQLRRSYHGPGVAYECGDCGSHNVVAVALKD